MTVEHSFFEHNTAVSVTQWLWQNRVLTLCLCARACRLAAGTFPSPGFRRLTLRF